MVMGQFASAPVELRAAIRAGPASPENLPPVPWPSDKRQGLAADSADELRSVPRTHEPHALQPKEEERRRNSPEDNSRHETDRERGAGQPPIRRPHQRSHNARDQEK